MPKVERWQLDQRVAQPLPVKVEMSKARIKAWYNAWDGEVYVAFSGGLDSTVVLHLARSVHPDIPAVFVNTGLEYPEIIKFVRATENVRWLKPKKRFREVVEEYGYPVVSKRISQYVKEIRNYKPGYTVNLRLTGIDREGKHRPRYMLSKKWRFLLDAPFKISDRCCYWMKKAPAIQSEKQYGWPMMGTRATESDSREAVYLRRGCNFFDTKRPISWPIAFWSHDDVWVYIRQNNIPYSPIYDMGYESTGCYACMFGVHMEKEPNRFQRMLKTHPKLWKYCIEKLELAKVLDYIKIPYHEPAQMRLFDLEEVDDQTA